MIARRCRVVLEYVEQGEAVCWAGDARARVDSAWLHMLADDVGHWQTFPASAVVCIDWWEPRPKSEGTDDVSRPLSGSEATDV